MSANSPESDSPRRPGAGFHTTQWSVVLAAGRASTPESAVALESLCAAYWYPLYAYVRRRVPDSHEAQDLTQAFFAELLEKNRVEAATPERGKFRAFLLASLKHFLANQWAKARAQKRGGGRSPLPLDFASAEARYCLEPVSRQTPEQVYERQWAVTLLGQIMQRLQVEMAERGKSAQFAQLKGFLIGEEAEASYASAAEKLGISTAAAKMAAHRLRRRYRELLREEISRTVAGPNGLAEELQYLFAILQSSD